MKKLFKLIAVSLMVAMLIGTLPFSHAQKQTVENIVQSDYENYLATGVDESNLVAGKDYVAGEILFRVKGGENEVAALASCGEDFGLEILEEIDQSALDESALLATGSVTTETLYRASFDTSKASVFELCKAMNRLPEVTNCEPNYTYAPESFIMPSEVSSSSLYSSMQKWYFDNMKMSQTWQQYENLGENTVVCVIDNGLNFEHNEIKNNLWEDEDGNHGYNAEFNNHDIYGKLSGGPAHGSHCAGIIAMESSNGGLVGVAPKAKIMACNAVSASTGMFTNANLIKSLEYAVANGADVISMSLGGYSFSFNMEKALAKASFSAVILCAAGNEEYSADERLHFPSASAAVIGVMALGSGSYTNRLSSYSNYDDTGRYYQVAAPGTDIYSIAAQSDTAYVSKTGTSMATPFMAGIAALYISEHPELSPTEARNAIIHASGEMVKGFYSSSPNYKKATPLTMLNTTCEPAQQAVFNDRYIYAAVCEALQIDSSAANHLTNYDLESVTYLDFHDKPFRNYSQLSMLPSLTYLNLSGTDMSDEDAQTLAQYLPQSLLSLDLSDNALKNLNFLDEYNGYLAYLNVSGNNIKDISGLEGFTMLSDLDISNNKILDISPIQSMTYLIYLYAPGNVIEDPSPVVGMRHLQEVYFGNYNPNFTDMFGELYFLSGSMGNHIDSLEAFMNLDKNNSSLHYINLSYNYIHRDSVYGYHAAKLMQTLNDIAEINDFKSIFGMNVNYKLVLSPDATDDLIEAQDIVFENDRNFTTLFLAGDAQKIPFRVSPANANSKNRVTFRVHDTSVAYVTDEGFLYPVSAGSTYVTLTLSGGKVRTFFVNVKDGFVAGAQLLNPSSEYTAQTEYHAVVYTAPCEAMRLSDQNGTVLGTFAAEGKYAYTFEDDNAQKFIKWIVPFSVETAGDYVIQASVQQSSNGAFSGKVGSFEMNVHEKFGYELSGAISAYNARFKTVAQLYAADDTLLQTQIITGGSGNNGVFRFTNVAEGVYKIVIEKDGCTPYTIENVVVDGDTDLHQNQNGSAAIDLTANAGDFNGDGVIDVGDISILLLNDNYAKEIANANNILCDLNADNSVNVSDLNLVLENLA